VVVENSAATREAISKMLNSAAGIKVVGEAGDGAEAVEMVARLRPDVITMDIKMPRMDGSEAARQIMAKTPTPIVLVTNVARQDMLCKGLDILMSGALEIVQKPGVLADQGLEAIRAELIAKVKSVSQIKFAGRPS
jgi:two-component system chemotaxis response regulator CheB